METFLVFGQDALNKTFSLNLPSAKHFEKIPNTEEHAGNDFDSLKLVFKKVIKRQNNFEERAYHLSTGSSMLTNELVQCQLKHPFPVAQGPVMLPVYCSTEEEKTVEDIIKEITFFGN